MVNRALIQVRRDLLRVVNREEERTGYLLILFEFLALTNVVAWWFVTKLTESTCDIYSLAGIHQDDFLVLVLDFFCHRRRIKQWPDRKGFGNRKTENCGGEIQSKERDEIK